MAQTALDFSDFIADRTRDFIITGEPGIGKSAIAARLTRIRDLAANSAATER